MLNRLADKTEFDSIGVGTLLWLNDRIDVYNSSSRVELRAGSFRVLKIHTQTIRCKDPEGSALVHGGSDPEFSYSRIVDIEDQNSGEEFKNIDLKTKHDWYLH